MRRFRVRRGCAFVCAFVWVLVTDDACEPPAGGPVSQPTGGQGQLDPISSWLLWPLAARSYLLADDVNRYTVLCHATCWQCAWDRDIDGCGRPLDWCRLRRKRFYFLGNSVTRHYSHALASIVHNQRDQTSITRQQEKKLQSFSSFRPQPADRPRGLIQTFPVHNKHLQQPSLTLHLS